MTTAPERLQASGARRRGPLSRREFRIYFAGNLVSNCGTWLQNVALAVYMRDLTHQSLWVGVTAAGLFIPVLALALPAGALADRADRLRLLLWSQVVAGALAGILTGLVATGSASRYVIVAIAFGLGVCVAVAIPAMQALIPSFVPPEELGDAIGLNALTFNIARVIGPITAAATLTTLGPVWAFGINAASFLVLIGALAMIRRPPFQRPGGRPGPMREGLAYAWRHTKTRTMLIAIVAIGVSIDPVITLSPALVRSWGLATGSAGWVVSGWGAGAVLWLTAGRSLTRRIAGRGLGWIGLLTLAAGVAGLGAARTFAEGIVSAVVIGAGGITATMAFTTAIQADVPERLRGRVMALWSVSFLGPRVFAAVIGGSLADAFGVHLATTCFVIPALAAAWLVRRTTPPRGAEVATPPA